MTKQSWDVEIVTGNSMSTLTDVLGYELLDLKAGVYHKFTFAGSVVLYMNDFGVKSVLVKPAGTKVQVGHF